MTVFLLHEVRIDKISTTLRIYAKNPKPSSKFTTRLLLCGR